MSTAHQLLHVAGRDCHFIRVSFPKDFRAPDRVKRPVCLIAAQRGLDPKEVGPIAEPLLQKEASYFCCYGPNASEVHHWIDEAILSHDFGVEDRVIPTVGEDGEALEEVIDFFTMAAVPTATEEYDYLILVIGDEAFADDLRRTVCSTASR